MTLVSAAAATLLALSAAAPATVPDRVEAAAEAARIASLESEVRRLRGLESRYLHAERGLLGDLEALGREAALAERELELVDLRIARSEGEAAALASRAGNLQQRVAAGQKELQQTLRAAYVRRSPDWLAVLIGSDSPADWPRNLALLARLGRRQSGAVERLARERDELTATEATLRQTTEDLPRLREESTRRRASADRARARKEQVLHDVQSRRGEVAGELRQAAGALAGLVQDLDRGDVTVAATDFASHKGRLPWPTEAPVSKRFGVDRHPRFATQIEHSGLDLAAALGTPVRSVHAGRVAFADWFKGYGYLVILDHGDSYYSLYAHLLKPEVGRGAMVSAGTRVGLAGDTGSIEGAHLYFEIRRAERALDPEAWLIPNRSRGKARR